MKFKGGILAIGLLYGAVLNIPAGAVALAWAGEMALGTGVTFTTAKYAIEKWTHCKK